MSGRMMTLAAVMAVGTASGVARAGGEHVFLITTDDGRASSGFLLSGAEGVVTCLHGVAGAKSIKAKTSGKVLLTEPLAITKVDVARDLVLLSSAEVKKLKGGLTPAVGTDVAKLKKVEAQVIGYPAGTDRKEIANTLTVQDPPTRELDQFLNAKLRKVFSDRQSPAPSITVLGLQGPLYPGHSGAPILDSAGNVIAVANGGLEFEQERGGVKAWKDTHLVWAIPLKDVTWTDATDPKVKEALARVAALDRPGVFALGDPKKTKLVLAEYAVLEAQGDTLVTITYSPPLETVATGVKETLEKLRDELAKQKELAKSRKSGGTVPGARDNAEFGEKINEGVNKAFFVVPSGTQIEILADRPEKAAGRRGLPVVAVPGDHYKVRVLSGDHEGKVGWVAGHFVRKKQVVGDK